MGSINIKSEREYLREIYTKINNGHYAILSFNAITYGRKNKCWICLIVYLKVILKQLLFYGNQPLNS
jgi:hypothetical protein